MKELKTEMIHSATYWVIKYRLANPVNKLNVNDQLTT